MDAVSQALLTGPSATRPFEGVVLPELERLLHCSLVAMYQVGYADSGVRVDQFVGRGISRPVTDAFKALVETAAPARWGYFDPLHPQVAQRNRALSAAQLQRLPGSTGMTEGMASWMAQGGIEDCDQLRVLVCEGDRLLGWVGGYREEPFGTRERTLLQQLVSPMRDCLLRRAHLADSALNAALLGPALEAIGAPAFVLSPTGSIRYANGPGHACLALRAEVPELLRAAVRSRKVPKDLTLTRITEPGVPGYSLAILRGPPADPAARVAAAVTRWGLTGREALVLELLARGLSNKCISSALRCATGTVEIHVSRLLNKAGEESRGALIASFWRHG
ncbi:MAG: helix-turn-helix transcriptional regulator [Myxococcaceae bacterium]